MTKTLKPNKRPRKTAERSKTESRQPDEFVETYRSLKPGDVELTERGRELKKLFDKVLK